MNCISPLCLRNLDDIINIQICVNRPFFGIQQICLVGFGTEKRVFIFFGKDTYSLNPQLIQSTIYANCNFATVCHKHLFKLLNLYFLHLYTSLIIMLFIQNPKFTIKNLVFYYNIRWLIRKLKICRDLYK